MNLQKVLPMIIVGIVALAALSGGGFYLYQRYQQSKVAGTDPTSSRAEVRKLVEVVGKLIDLPVGEEPTVATVTDIEKLKDQAFFQKAKNGDKVLIYTNARKAILYDPAAAKIIEVAPINIGSDSAQQSQNQSAKIVLRNGTSTSGLTTRVEAELKKTFPDLNVVTKENASKTDYSKTVVIVINDNAKNAANKLSDILKASITSLPSGESKPSDADIVIILGKDRI